MKPKKLIRKRQGKIKGRRYVSHSWSIGGTFSVLLTGYYFPRIWSFHFALRPQSWKHNRYVTI